MSTRRRTFAEKKSQGIDFLDYIAKKNINIVGLTKKELQNIYVNEYQEHNTNAKPLTFAPLIQALFTCGRLHLRGPHIYKGPAAPPYLNSHRKERGQHSNVEGNQNNNSDGYVRRSNRRSPPHKRFGQVAVNQHVVINRSYSPSPITSHESSPAPDIVHRPSASSLPQSGMDSEHIKRVGNYYECKICGARSTSSVEMGKHSQGKKHRLGVMTAELKKQRDFLVKDREGIAIIGENAEYLNGTYHIQIQENIERTMSLRVENHTPEVMELLHCEMLKRMRVFKLDDAKKMTEGREAVSINSGSHYVIEVSACARGLGTFHVPIAFHFRRSSGKEFHIIRFLNAKCVSDITEELKPTSPYKPPTRVAEYCEWMETVPGVKPPKYE